MSRISLAVAVCTTLAACSAGPAPKHSESVPPELVPDGYTAAECRVADPGGAITETGPDGRPVTVGERKPRVECAHHTEHVIETHTATCHTPKGKELPVSDCCLNPDGTQIPQCKPRTIYPEDDK